MSGTAVVGFSFALRAPEFEPNPCNQRLGHATIDLMDARPIKMVILQWEVARDLKMDIPHHRRRVDYTVGLRQDGSYLDSRGVWDEAKAILKANGIDRVIIVAQPFIQRFVIRRWARKDGFTVVRGHVGWIGFDNSLANTQPWTRSAFAFVRYLVTRALGRKGGHDGMQAA